MSSQGCEKCFLDNPPAFSSLSSPTPTPVPPFLLPMCLAPPLPTLVKLPPIEGKGWLPLVLLGLGLGLVQVPLGLIYIELNMAAIYSKQGLTKPNFEDL